MLQGFKNLLLRVNEIIAEEWQELKNDPDILFDTQIENIAIHNLRYNLQLLISEIETRKLDKTKIICQNIDNNEEFDFNTLTFSDYDFNSILEVIKEVMGGLKKYYLQDEKFHKMHKGRWNDDPKELFFIFNLVGIYELLDHISASNIIFFELYQSIRKDTLAVRIFIMEKKDENN